MKKFNLIIDGKKVATEKYFNVINPATLEVVGQCPSAENSHLDQAVIAAQRAFGPWAATDDSVRARKLHEIADAIEQLLGDPALVEKLSRGAAAFAAEHFSWPRSARRLLEFYCSLTPLVRPAAS